MRRKLLTAVVMASFVLAASWALAGPPHWLKGTTDQKFSTLEKIQEALGSVMMEYNYRMTTMYYAAKGGNWGLADYQLKEAREIQEVGETTRPQFAGALKAFEQTYLDKVAASVKEKNFSKFKKAFTEMTKGCNECHANEGYPFIHYVLPKHPVRS
ncbi:MAG: hypothetical protein M0Z75_03185, partial [Nitrospiraceae bacterium]|nr:hypothetical protein [Nitrospiraceae bacterium]